MDGTVGVRSGSGKRVYRTVAEKRRIVELTLQPGASVAKVAQAEAVNSHQIFDWRRAYLKGKLELKGRRSAALLPVVISPAEACAITVDATVAEQKSVKTMAATRCGVIHIELAGGATVRVEGDADSALLRTVLESLRR